MRRVTATREYRSGRVGELKLANWFRRAGCQVALVNSGGDVAPLLHGWAKDLVLPDLQVFIPVPAQQLVWVEGKVKSTCGHFDLAGISTSGIDWPKFVHYEQVERVTGYRVLVAHMIESLDAVYLADLHSGRVPGAGAGKAMAWWDLAKLQYLCSYRELMGTIAAPQQIEMPLFAPPPPPPIQMELL